MYIKWAIYYEGNEWSFFSWKEIIQNECTGYSFLDIFNSFDRLGLISDEKATRLIRKDE